MAYKLWITGLQLTVDYWTIDYISLDYLTITATLQNSPNTTTDYLLIFEETEDTLFSLNSQRANSGFFIEKIQPWLLVAHKKSQPSRRWRSNLKYIFLIALFRKIEDRQLSTTSLKGKLVQLASKNPLYFVDYATISIRRKDLQHLNRFNVKHCNLKSWRWKQVLLFLCFAICSIDSRLGFYNKKNRGNFTPSKNCTKNIFSFEQ